MYERRQSTVLLFEPLVFGGRIAESGFESRGQSVCILRSAEVGGADHGATDGMRSVVSSSVHALLTVECDAK